MIISDAAAAQAAKHVFYYSPGTCSLAPHIVLEEIGKPYELALVSASGAREGEMTSTPAWKAINPKGRVPALLGVAGRIGGAAHLLREVPAILTYLARTNPTAGLFPSDPAAEARCIEWMSWLSSTVHSMAFAQMWRSHRFTTDEGGLRRSKTAGGKTSPTALPISRNFSPTGGNGQFRRATPSSMHIFLSSTIGAAAASGWTWRLAAQTGRD